MNKKETEFLLTKIWQNPLYYEKCHQHNLLIQKNPWFRKIKNYCQGAKKVLDVGCGEGTNLIHLAPPSAQKFGIDLSPLAIKIARQQYPENRYEVAAAQELPFSDNYFDCVYTIAVLEHLADPQKALKEMIRVCAPEGKIIIFTVNLGSPLFRSPVDQRSPLAIITQTLKTEIRLLWPGRQHSLQWRKVKPRLKSIADYEPDRDILNEPYLLSLIKFFSNQTKVKIIEASSEWLFTADEIFRPFFRRIIKLLYYTGILRIYPFKYWGRLLFMVLEKEK